MFRSRLTRTIANLSLIVVMMIQPGISLVFASDCGAKCASGFICEGCGCCDVSSPTEKCGCCGGGDASGGGSCCTETAEPPDEESVNGLQVIVISTTDTGEIGEDQAREITNTCHCGVESQPLGESSPSRPTIERHDSIAIRFADLATIFGEAAAKARRGQLHDSLGLLAHFSQIHLCIWRL